MPVHSEDVSLQVTCVHGFDLSLGMHGDTKKFPSCRPELTGKRTRGATHGQKRTRGATHGTDLYFDAQLLEVVGIVLGVQVAHQIGLVYTRDRQRAGSHSAVEHAPTTQKPWNPLDMDVMSCVRASATA